MPEPGEGLTEVKKKVCPFLTLNIPISVAPTLAGGAPRARPGLLKVECLEKECALWNGMAKKCSLNTEPQNVIEA